MIADLGPYPEYRESGLPWVGQVPEHWTLAPNRAMLRRRKVLVGKQHSDYKLLSLTKSGVIVRDISTGKGKFSADMGTSQEVRKGDLVFCLFDVPETPRTVGLSLHDGMITGAYTVFECSDTLLASYLDSFYRSMDDRKLLSPLYSGLRNTIPPPRFLGTKTPLPPPDEQAAIVRFLNHANQRIERTIRAKRKVIALLNEQKQVIIHRAVTRGLDPNVRLKPSGIPWLGEVPEGWEIMQLRRVVSLVTSGSRGWAKYYCDAGDVFLQSGNLGRSMALNLSFIQHVKLPTGSEGIRTKVVEDDLLVCITGALTGNVVHVDIDIPAAYVNQHVALVRPRCNMVYPRFLAYLLRSNAGQSQFKTSEYGGTKQGLGLGDVKSIFVALPSIELQQQMSAALDAQITQFDIPISRTEREISLLREYRTRLIADVVTGKLDVREAAAQLPDDTDNFVITNDLDNPFFEEGEDDGTATEE